MTSPLRQCYVSFGSRDGACGGQLARAAAFPGGRMADLPTGWAASLPVGYHVGAAEQDARISAGAEEVTKPDGRSTEDRPA